MITRRGFLASLGAAIAAATLAPEKLLWRPGAKLISIPRPSPAPFMFRADAYARFMRVGMWREAYGFGTLLTVDDVNPEMAILPRVGDHFQVPTRPLFDPGKPQVIGPHDYYIRVR